MRSCSRRAWISARPGWMRAPVRARLAWQPGRLRIDQVTASNNRYTVQARMQSGGDAVDGQLLAHWGPLAVGVGLRNGRREFHLLRPAHWYEAQRLP